MGQPSRRRFNQLGFGPDVKSSTRSSRNPSLFCELQASSLNKVSKTVLCPGFAFCIISFLSPSGDRVGERQFQ